jgi:16S rRNA processing protein RimM
VTPTRKPGPASDSAPPLRLGLIGRAHGLAGAFRVVGAADWYVFRPGATLLLDGRERELLTVAGTQQSPILELSGMHSREDAAAVLGHALELRASDAPEPEEDAFWVRDLVGMRARCGARELGLVSDVLERPANDVLVLRLTDGREHLVPFTREAVPGVDVGRRVLELAEAFADPLDG